MRSSIYQIAVALVLGLSISACKKDQPVTGGTSNNPTSMSELKVPGSFSYATTHSVDYSFSLSNASVPGKYKVEIYDFTPTAGGSLIKSAFLDQASSAQGKVELPTATKEVFVKLTAPTGSSILNKVSVNGKQINETFSAGKKALRKTTVVSPTCTSGCDHTYNNRSSNLNINSNDPGGVYCMQGNHTGNINVNRGGVIIRFCGNAVVQNLNINSGSSLEIASGGSLRVNNLNINSSNGTLTVYPNADLVLTNNFSTSAQITNYGNIEVANNFNLNSSGSMLNNGYVEVGVDYNNNSTSTNNNHIYVKDDVFVNGGSDFTNNCKLIIDDDLHNNGDLTNLSYIFVGDEYKVNGGAGVQFENGAMLEANRITVNNQINATGSTSIIKLVDNPSFGNSLKTTINGGGGFNGNIEFCDPDGIETNNGSFTNGATLGCDVYIPTSSCNPSGNGTPQVSDADNDGVADDLDAYPNDPARASNDFSPSENDFGTLAYEDLWPAKGDFDFNDLVVDYNYKLVKNANNEVVDVIARYVVRAIGGSFTNGFGIQFDAAPGSVASVSGQELTENIITNGSNGTENGQTKATVIVFDNAFEILPNLGTPFVNTVDGEAYSTPDTLDLTVNFGTPQTLANLGTVPFNPFMIINKERGKEVHLAGMAPTDLANSSFFGTADDDTNVGAGKFYQSTTNLPWALNIATGFDYPKEKVDIVPTYTNFASWAQSGGSQNEDWYVDLPGYRNNTNVYQEP